jgi:hypothetical protein
MFIFLSPYEIHIPSSNNFLFIANKLKTQESFAWPPYCYSTFYKNFTKNVAYFSKPW